MKYKAQVNNHFQFDISEQALQDFDFVPNGKDTFHIVKDGKSYKANVIALDYERKAFELKVNGRVYRVALENEFDRIVNELGLEVASSSKLRDVKAPMPGLVLEISVEVGQEINQGDKLLILEAMKMENVIKSDGEGIVKAIHINKGIAVDKGQMLIEME